MSSEKKNYFEDLKIACEKNELLFVSKFNEKITLDWSMKGQEDLHISMTKETAKELIYYIQELVDE